VDLDDPTHLQFNYIEVFADLAAVIDAPVGLRTLHIGGGGFTFPRYLDVIRPDSSNLVLEIDGVLLDLARSDLGLVTSDRLEVRIGDARTAVRGLPDADLDLVIGDAFGGLAVPWHLTTREFVTDVARVLRPEGVYALNVIDRPPNRFVKAEVATIAAVFAHVGVIAPTSYLSDRDGGNFVVIASQSPIDGAAIEALLTARNAREVLLIEPVEVSDWIAGAMILTDDHAPVDQLITTR
jgi:spermidine synthase